MNAIAMIATPPPAGSTEVLNADHSTLIADWLSGLFLAPLSIQALERLRDAQVADLFDEIGRFLECRAATQQMNEALYAGSPPDVTRNLERRYTSLFDGVAGRHTVALYESAYSGTGDRLFQKPFNEMQEILRRLDFSIQENCWEPADHISVELAALATAVRTEANDMTDALSKRLATWTPQFLARINKVDPGGFYSGAATVLAAFVSSLAGRQLSTSYDEASVSE